MTEILKDYLNKIREALHGWPPADADDAVNYYEEFIEDALEQSLSEKQILKKLGNPQQIIKTIKAENSIRKTEVKPGPLKLMKSIVGIPALKVSVILGGIIPIVTAYLLYLLAVISYIAIAGGILFSLYAIRQIDPQYIWSIIGMTGFAFISTALFGFFGFLIWRIANSITLHTMKLLRRFLNRERTAEIKQTSPGKHSDEKKNRTKRAVIAFLIIFAIGAIMLIPSGLPVRYFSIWNSQMPYNYTERRAQFPADQVKTISVDTLNSKVLLIGKDSGQVTVLYQQPDWMTGEIIKEGSTIQFTEKPNGRLPYMQFVSRHEGMTSVTVALPKEEAVDTVSIRTNGGTVIITPAVADLNRISVKAGAGRITVNGSVLKSGTFRKDNGKKGIINIKNSNGDVNINPKEISAE